VVSFTPRPLSLRGKSLRYPLKRRLGGPQNRSDVKRRKFLPLPGLELRPFGRPARSSSLYRLSYPPATETERDTGMLENAAPLDQRLMLSRPSDHARCTPWAAPLTSCLRSRAHSMKTFVWPFTRPETTVESHFLYWPLVSYLPNCMELIVVQVRRKLTEFCGTRRVIAVFTRAHHWSLS
jgi:hypothetical protein